MSRVRPGAGLVSGANTNRGFSRIVLALVWLIITPSVVLLVLGILMLVFSKANLNILFGILVVTLVGLLATGTVLALVFVRREAALSTLQSDFVSKVSHELRTPLTSILGYLELVLDDPELGEESRAHLGTVERNAQRLLRLVGDLLFTAQVDAGRFSLQPEDVDLAAVVRAAEETARVTAGATGVEVAVDVPDGGLVVHGDAVRLGQACDNLVSNAVKFTPAGGRVTLTLRAAWRTPDGAVVGAPQDDAVPVARLAVSDTGIGIPAGEQAQLCTRFFRASTARRHAVPGVGLGLAITRAIATAHDGTLEVSSVEGEGTTFTVTLPR